MPRPQRLALPLRILGKTLVTGTRQDIIAALDKAIQPDSAILERLSDMVLGHIADVVIEGRASLVAGIREGLDQVPAL